ncbi:MAG: 4-hydroxy-3-methylbut-2-enyl diphosphate reductase [Candidatus Cloacimonetes bacterium]|jgi:4-hydroxy-3-methylbut-2-enyl diphosphate reductase|nr:4-hydroxy-3-methylbut-2-enyl diphosphate reductase [Candidatus Cloacimonadota bacterium]MBT4333261.1 4-hydroxy-3-methylbut-2-enyl diphosphate reductase [Candidatus Cloacimonadota bacterium]MBT4574971.1 4-hydroxy-3-methylbut-2-enyl diphosphate reductase [Candidatus Cloacimonadota bacterium]
MSVRIAKNSGFCFGVKRAIKVALKTSKDNHEIVTLGPIIHNPQMVAKLEQENIIKVDKLEEIEGRPTIIRSHGVKKEILNKLEQNNIEIINATCPYVSKTQDYAKSLSEDGYELIIMGDRNHPEVKALRSYVDKEVMIVANASELADKQFKKVGIISQTTRRVEDLQELVKKIVPQSHEVRVINTICNATTIRQNSTLALAKESDVMIVVGGKNSSNTKMLAKICESFVKTYHIEVAGEIDKKWLNDKQDIGLTAGASTPDWVIVEVYNKILECIGSINKVDNIEDIPGFKED